MFTYVTSSENHFPRYKKDKLIRKSIRELDPKLYTRDAFNISCKVVSENGDHVSKPGGPEFFIFDERGEQFAATYIICPVLENSKPHQVSP